jgi:hypothetical protein
MIETIRQTSRKRFKRLGAMDDANAIRTLFHPRFEIAQQN